MSQLTESDELSESTTLSYLIMLQLMHKHTVKKLLPLHSKACCDEVISLYFSCVKYSYIYILWTMAHHLQQQKKIIFLIHKNVFLASLVSCCRHTIHVWWGLMSPQYHHQRSSKVLDSTSKIVVLYFLAYKHL
jgi:hypothetical protein